MKFSVFQVSRRGGREKNEDRMGYCHTRESSLLLLADGMGGHPEGEVAAQLALQTISMLYQRQALPTLKDTAGFLASALMMAHHQIIRYADEKDMRETPRTTLVAAVVQDAAVTWVHCGDSRLYLVRGGELLARTRDHSYLEQHSAGVVLRFEHVNRNMLYTCLGAPSKPVYEVVGPLALQQGDKILLCSDGLWSSLSDAEIVRLLGSRLVSDAVPELVEQALRRAGEHCDNVTAVALEWEMPDSFGATHGHIHTTDGISEGMFASTFQAGVLDALVGDLNDAAIERSIAEINEAIERSAARRG